MMTATITSGRIMSSTGKYRIFFNTGTAVMFFGYLYMLLMLDASTPIWVISIGMIMIGLGLGQLMQTTMVASQNSVDAKDIGVATSSATFFRQMGGTFGVAVFMSILFGQVADKIGGAFQRADVREGIAAATKDPAVLANPDNEAILGVLQGGPSAAEQITLDSSFMIGADDRLTLPFRIGFVESSLTVFLVAIFFVAAAFVISWFIKEIPLRDKSASQEAAESAKTAGMSH
jgi:hypothetical protein